MFSFVWKLLIFQKPRFTIPNCETIFEDKILTVYKLFGMTHYSILVSYFHFGCFINNSGDDIFLFTIYQKVFHMLLLSALKIHLHNIEYFPILHMTKLRSIDIKGIAQKSLKQSKDSDTNLIAVV